MAVFPDTVHGNQKYEDKTSHWMSERLLTKAIREAKSRNGRKKLIDKEKISYWLELCKFLIQQGTNGISLGFLKVQRSKPAEVRNFNNRSGF